MDLLVCDNYNVPEFDYGYGPSSGPLPETGVFGVDEDRTYEESNNEYDEDVDDDCNGDEDVEVHGHASSFRTFWRMNKGYMSLHKHHLVMYQISQMMRH